MKREIHDLMMVSVLRILMSGIVFQSDESLLSVLLKSSFTEALSPGIGTILFPARDPVATTLFNLADDEDLA